MASEKTEVDFTLTTLWRLSSNEMITNTIDMVVQRKTICNVDLKLVYNNNFC